MATIRKLREKWQVIVRRKNYPNISKVFTQKSLANQWAKETELAMEKEQFDDLTTASETMLKTLLMRYRDEITVKKKGARSETYRLNWLIRHKISEATLTRLKSKDLYNLKSELSEQNKKPATIILTLLCIYPVAFNSLIPASTIGYPVSPFFHFSNSFGLFRHFIRSYLFLKFDVTT